jgi:hypothetical protein
MTAHVMRQVKGWIDLSMSRLGLNTKPTPSHRGGDGTGYTDISKQPYQNPGKDKNHPGDDAAVRSSTEQAKETPTAH